MQVSKSFKALAAPLLYEQLDWKYMQRNPMLIKRGNVIKAVSGINTKEDELQHIKSIDLQNHLVKDCPVTDGRARLPPLKIPLVHIDMRKTEVDDVSNNQYCLDHSRCNLLQGQSANKIVVSVNTDDQPTGLRHLSLSSVEEHVVKLNFRSTPRWRSNLHSESRAKQLVIILSPVNHDTSTTSPPPNGPSMWTCIDLWADHLAYDSRIHNSPSDIVMVNFDDAEDGIISHPACKTGVFERLCRNAINRFRPRNYIELKGDQRWRTASEAALVSIKFITMKKYLGEYDWDGVYTKEEVAELLRAEEVKGSN